MVFIPLMADQPMVAKRSEDLGLGIKLDKERLTIEQIRSATHKILGDQSYYVKVKQYSDVSRRYKGAESIKREIIEYIDHKTD